MLLSLATVEKTAALYKLIAMIANPLPPVIGIADNPVEPNVTLV